MDQLAENGNYIKLLFSLIKQLFMPVEWLFDIITEFGGLKININLLHMSVTHKK